MPESVELKAAAIVIKLAQELVFPEDPVWRESIAKLIANDLRRFPDNADEIEEGWRRSLALGKKMRQLGRTVSGGK